MPHRFSHLLALIALIPMLGLSAIGVVSLTGCPRPSVYECSKTCPEDYTCGANGLCLAPRIETYDGKIIPGKYLQLLFQDRTVITASILERSGTQGVNQIILGEGKRGADFAFYAPKLSAKKLSEYTLLAPRSNTGVALAAGPEFVYLVWLGTDGIFRIGRHRKTDGPGRWGFSTIKTEPHLTYRATSDFTLAVTPSGGLLIAFHDANGNFLSLERPFGLDEKKWDLRAILLRSDAPNTTGCLRNGPGRRAGVGLAPSAADSRYLLGATDIVLSHFDGDCGALLVSERIDGKWRTTLVDPGQKLLIPLDKGELSRVGSMSSVAVSPTGKVGIAYNDETLGQLKYATRTTSRIWRTTTVDNGEINDGNGITQMSRIGTFPSLNFLKDGRPVVTYQDSTNHRIKLAERQTLGSNWKISNLNSVGFVGFFQKQSYNENEGRVVGTEVLEQQGVSTISRLRLIWIDQ